MVAEMAGQAVKNPLTDRACGEIIHASHHGIIALLLKHGGDQSHRDNKANCLPESYPAPSYAPPPCSSYVKSIGLLSIRHVQIFARFKSPSVRRKHGRCWRIIEAQRGQHPEFVFTYAGHRVGTMNNNGWQHARAKVGLGDVHIHDLRHTYASRLRLAGVHQEDRNALMGHKSASIPEHYASADIGHLIELANKVLDRQDTKTLLRVVNG